MIDTLYYIVTTMNTPFTTLEYYTNSINRSFLSSLLTLLSIILALSFVSSFIFIQQTYPGIINSIQNTISDVSKHYPEDLIIDWDGSKLTANKDVVVIPWRDDFNSQNQEFPKQFLYYANSSQSPDELNIKVTQSLFFINQHTLYHSNDENPSTWTAQPLQNILTPDTSVFVDKNIVVQTSDKAQEFISSNSVKISALFFSAYSLIFVSSKMLFLIIETVLVVLLFKLYAIKLQTKQTIILSMHIMIPTVVVNTIAEILYTNVSIPLQTITFWILIIFISSQFKSKVIKIK